MQGLYSRRGFLKTATARGAAWALSAASYARVIGANDRISIAQIGCGGRGIGAHMAGIHAHQADKQGKLRQGRVNPGNLGAIPP